MITCLPFPATDPHPRIHVRMKKHTKVQTIIEIRNYHRQTPIISTRRNTKTKLPSLLPEPQNTTLRTPTAPSPDTKSIP